MTSKKIAVIGLGYVGLPVAQRFASKYPVIGYDINEERVAELRNAIDTTLEVSSERLQSVLNPSSDDNSGLYITSKTKYLASCTYYIITVPTPVDSKKKPDLTPLYKASELVGKHLKTGDTVIYESTVYPGATEEECVPILAKNSGLTYNEDFYVGYSPERINPGDEEHTIDKIIKVTSGSTPKIAKEIDELYASVISAGTHMAPSIKVAEAAKVIENAQRDINIAFVNELAKIFNLMDIDTHSVLEAAATKWNFMRFKPGLVGGHCIGVDPYYLAQKAHQYGYHPEILLTGRRINDGMGNYIASEIIKLLTQKQIEITDASILVLGITFKENCPDIRNTKVVDLITEFLDLGSNVTVYDPGASLEEVQKEYALDVTVDRPEATFDVIILAVAHDQFLELDLEDLCTNRGFIYDVKGVLGSKADFRL